MTTKMPMRGGREMPVLVFLVAVVMWGDGLALLISPVLDAGAPRARAIGACLVILASLTFGLFATKQTPAP